MEDKSVFLEAEEQAHQLVDTLTELKKQIETYKGSSEQYKTTNDALSTLISRYGQTANEMNLLVSSLKNIGLQQISDKLDQAVNETSVFHSDIRDVSTQDAERMVSLLSAIQEYRCILDSIITGLDPKLANIALLLPMNDKMEHIQTKLIAVDSNVSDVTQRIIENNKYSSDHYKATSDALSILISSYGQAANDMSLLATSLKNEALQQISDKIDQAVNETSVFHSDMRDVSTQDAEHMESLLSAIQDHRCILDSFIAGFDPKLANIALLLPMNDKIENIQTKLTAVDSSLSDVTDRVFEYYINSSDQYKTTNDVLSVLVSNYGQIAYDMDLLVTGLKEIGLQQISDKLDQVVNETSVFRSEIRDVSAQDAEHMVSLLSSIQEYRCILESVVAELDSKLTNIQLLVPLNDKIDHIQTMLITVDGNVSDVTHCVIDNFQHLESVASLHQASIEAMTSKLDSLPDILIQKSDNSIQTEIITVRDELAALTSKVEYLSQKLNPEFRELVTTDINPLCDQLAALTTKLNDLPGTLNRNTRDMIQTEIKPMRDQLDALTSHVNSQADSNQHIDVEFYDGVSRLHNLLYIAVVVSVGSLVVGFLSMWKH